MVNLQVYEKNEKNIEEEKSLYNYAARIVKGQSKKVCKHYLIDSNNNKIDISDITSERCFSMVKEVLNSIKLRRISKEDISGYLIK